MSSDDIVTLVGFLRIVVGLAVIGVAVWLVGRRRRRT